MVIHAKLFNKSVAVLKCRFYCFTCKRFERAKCRRVWTQPMELLHRKLCAQVPDKAFPIRKLSRTFSWPLPRAFEQRKFSKNKFKFILFGGRPFWFGWRHRAARFLALISYKSIIDAEANQRISVAPKLTDSIVVLMSNDERRRATRHCNDGWKKKRNSLFDDMRPMQANCPDRQNVNENHTECVDMHIIALTPWKMMIVAMAKWRPISLEMQFILYGGRR